jgi:hypothetical protein
MHCVSTSESMKLGQVPSVTLDRCGELDRTRGSPIVFPSSVGCRDVPLVEVMVASRRCERGTLLRIGQTARNRRAAVPHVGSQVAASFLDDQLHKALESK